MFQPDERYFAQRLAQEIALAQQASCPEAAKIHMELALAYQARVPAPPDAQLRA